MKDIICVKISGMTIYHYSQPIKYLLLLFFTTFYTLWNFQRTVDPNIIQENDFFFKSKAGDSSRFACHFYRRFIFFCLVLPEYTDKQESDENCGSRQLKCCENKKDADIIQNVNNLKKKTV